jgi:hypothetical protein
MLPFLKMIIILRLAHIGSLLQLTSSFQKTLAPPSPRLSEHKLAAIEYFTNRVLT